MILDVLRVYFCFSLLLSNKSKGKKKEFKVTRGARVWVNVRVLPHAPFMMCWRSCSAKVEHLPVEKMAYLRSFNQKKKKKNQFCRPRSQFLSHLQVNRALSPELNWLFTWVRWAGLVPGSSTYSAHYKTRLKSHEVRQQKRLNELT